MTSGDRKITKPLFLGTVMGSRSALLCPFPSLSLWHSLVLSHSHIPYPYCHLHTPLDSGLHHHPKPRLLIHSVSNHGPRRHPSSTPRNRLPLQQASAARRPIRTLHLEPHPRQGVKTSGGGPPKHGPEAGKHDAEYVTSPRAVPLLRRARIPAWK